MEQKSTDKYAGSNLLLHLVVFIFGFTGILGKLITIDGVMLVWYRTLIGAVSMLLILLLSRRLRLPGTRTTLYALGTGLIVAAHWITFFHSIKISNVSIALACLSVSTLFVAFLEPVFFREKISIRELLIGIVIIGGISLILGVEFRYIDGIITGLVSAFFSALFTVINRKITHSGDGFMISFLEIAGGFAAISLFYLVSGGFPDMTALPASDWMYLLLLGTVCTAFAFWGIMKVLRELKAYHVVLAINLEPIYGFVMAAVFFREDEMLTPYFYVGSLVIIASVFVYSYSKSNFREKLRKAIKKS